MTPTIDLEEVAAIYMQALKQGQPPSQAVERAFNRPRTTVTKWVRRAKDAGMIPDANHADSRPYNAKLLAVAMEIGVPASALKQAILTHASGDLRIK